MYSLCRDTVILSRGGETICLENCALQRKQVQRKDRTGTWADGEFLLIVPGDRPIYPGDKVCTDGAKMTIRTVIPYFQEGKISHREGRGS